MRLAKVLVDQGFADAVIIHETVRGITVEVVRRPPPTKAFVPTPKRWVVEQVYRASTAGMLRRLTAPAPLAP